MATEVVDPSNQLLRYLQMVGNRGALLPRSVRRCSWPIGERAFSGGILGRVIQPVADGSALKVVLSRATT